MSYQAAAFARITRRWAVLGAGMAIAFLGSSGCQTDENSTAKPLIIAISGDTSGWIVPCGCVTNQSGGLLRRGSYLDQLKEQGELLYLDAGGALQGESPYDLAKFEAIIRGERAMGVALHNVGAAEAALKPDQLRQIENSLGNNPFFLSANVQDADGRPFGIPSKVLELAGRRVQIIGVISPHYATDDIQISDPSKAILDELERSPKGGDHELTIVLAYLPEEELRELASKLPEVDVIVGGPTGQAMAPEKVGRMLLASATNKGKFLIRLNVPAEANPQITGEAIELTDKFTNSQKQQENLDQFYRELAARDFSADETSFVFGASVNSNATHQIAGTTTCRECHETDCQVWDQTPHAHAWQTLLKTGSHVDSYCQQCHVTGFGVPGGFVSAKRSPSRVNVGCESCHGPSLQHAENPQMRTFHFENAAATCVHCHDPENSPSFDYSDYWPRVEHGIQGALK